MPIDHKSIENKKQELYIKALEKENDGLKRHASILSNRIDILKKTVIKLRETYYA